MKEIRLSEKLAGEEGFEPSLPGPEPGVLPLDDSPATDVAELKSSPLPGLLNGIIPFKPPLNLPQKAAEIGQQIQSLLSNPPDSPIISPHPADINAPYFRHGSLVPSLKSYYQTLTRRIKNSVFVRMTRAWMLANYEGREVILC